MIIDIVKKDIIPPHIEDDAINTLAIMEEYKITTLPVVDGKNKFLGVIDEDSIINMDNLQNTLQFLKNKFKNISISLNAHFFESIKIITENKISILPVVNQNNNYIGYITAVDLIKMMGAIYHNHAKISIIVISINRKDYMLSEISRLVEENSGKIMKLWTEKNKDKINLHLLITCQNTQSILQSLERYGYDVTKSVLNDIENNNLDDRFESFINYLNI